MYTLHPTWTRIGGVLVSFMLATTPIMPTVALAATAESVDKTETVHVQATPTGEIDSVTVEDTLSNSQNTQELQDRTTLTNIEPSDEDLSYTQGDDGNLTWNTPGDTVTYKGSASEQLPVDVKVTYTLDGTERQPVDLAGATGHLTIRIDYHNTSVGTYEVNGTPQSIYTPFVCMTVSMLDSDVFHNVQVENGKIIDDKGGLAVIGYAAPGLRESLALGDDVDFDIPEYVLIEADVTDLSMDPIYTIVTPELLTDLDTSDLDFGDFGDGTDKLQEAMDQLVSGSGTLSEALRALSNATSQIGGGVQEFREKLGLLPTGFAALTDGATQLADGIDATKDAADQLAQGSKALPTAADAASGSVTAAQAGVGAAQEKVTGAQGSVAQVKAAADNVNLDSIKNAATEAKDAAKAVTDAAGVAKQALADTTPEVSGKEAATQSLDGASESLAALDAIDTTGMTDAQIVAINNAKTATQQKIDESKTNVEAISASVTAPDLSALDSAISTLNEKTEALGASTVDLSTVIDATKAAQESLEAAAGSLAATGEGFDGAQQAIAGLSQAAGGISAGATGIAGALGQTGKGARTLATQLGSISSSMPYMLAGVDGLSSGLGQLSGALDATATGSEQLTDGLNTFNNEGISKLVDSLDDMGADIDDLTARLDALREAARAYDSFAGKLDEHSGSVRFIYKTAQIG